MGKDRKEVELPVRSVRKCRMKGGARGCTHTHTHTHTHTAFDNFSKIHKKERSTAFTEDITTLSVKILAEKKAVKRGGWLWFFGVSVNPFFCYF